MGKKMYDETVIRKLTQNVDAVTGGARLFGVDKQRPLNEVEQVECELWRAWVGAGLEAKCSQNDIRLYDVLKGYRRVVTSDAERLYLAGWRQRSK